MDNLSKYLEDVTFISWVFEPTDELDLYWKQFEEKHSEEIRNIKTARKIILQFRTVARSLSEEEKIILFSRILNQIEQRQKSKKISLIFWGMLKYAAIAIIFFSLGALLFYRPTVTNSEYMALNSEKRNSENQAQLIRSNGENLILGEQQSVIEYKKSGELVINKDTIHQTASNLENGSGLNTLIIPYGKTAQLILPDSSKVFLNAGSRLSYPDHFKAESREVMLLGEAYFEVKHDDKHPFIVQVNNLRIKDLGTKFNVSAYPGGEQIETVLTEGKVSIKRNNSGLFTKDTELIPGQLASFDRQTNQIKVKMVDVEAYTLWTLGLMKFESADLSQIIQKLERYYNVQFQLKDPMLGALKISGKLELKENLDEVIDRIAHTASVSIEKNGDNNYTIMK